MNITFLGAAQTVTGSSFLLQTNGLKIIVDCGMFQGPDVEDRNDDAFTFDPKEINFVILTHAHLDHCGLLPKLYKHGFRGPVFMSLPTRVIVEHMLFDSAKIQEFNFNKGRDHFRKKKRGMVSEAGLPALKVPLYDTTDVIGLLGQSQAIDFGERYTLTDNVAITFLRAGHALGAASVLVEIKKDSKRTKVLFSGDLGNTQQFLDARIDYPQSADYVVMESLYGGINHQKREDTLKTFTDSINTTLQRGGNVIIPAFSLQRTQELLYILKRLIEKGDISKEVKVFVDGPLGIKITEVYKRFYQYLNPDVVENMTVGEQVFACRNFEFTLDAARSMRIRKTKGSIIIAGSGMCTGGRIVFHLMDNLPDKRASVLFVGYQADGTLGREILDGAKDVFIDNRPVKVNADIVRIEGFSAHAGNDDLLKWIGSVSKDELKSIYLVHADEERSKPFQKILQEKGYDATIAEWKKTYEL